MEDRTLTADELLTAVCMWLREKADGLRCVDKHAARTLEWAADDLPLAADELRGIAWWNGMTEAGRLDALRAARAAGVRDPSAADAYRVARGGGR